MIESYLVESINYQFFSFVKSAVVELYILLLLHVLLVLNYFRLLCNLFPMLVSIYMVVRKKNNAIVKSIKEAN